VGEALQTNSPGPTLNRLVARGVAKLHPARVAYAIWWDEGGKVDATVHCFV